MVLTEEDYNSSVMEWNKKAKIKKWYHVTADAFINYLYEVIVFSKLRLHNSVLRAVS